METRHRVEGSFGSEFPAICNHCVVVDLWRPEVARRCEILCEIFAFYVKRTPYGKIFKIMFRKFSSRHRSTLLCSNFVKFGPRKIGEIVRYLPLKQFRLPLKLSLISGSRPKSARSGPQQFTQRAADLIQIGSL